VFSAGSGLFGTLLLGLALGGYTDLSLLLAAIIFATLLIFEMPRLEAAVKRITALQALAALPTGFVVHQLVYSLF